jgi:hypothetical protein
MMGLDFREKVCSGNICCNPAKDTICSFDRETPGAGSADLLFPLIIAAVILVLITVAYLLMRKKNSDRPAPKNP